MVCHVPHMQELLFKKKTPYLQLSLYATLTGTSIVWAKAGSHLWVSFSLVSLIISIKLSYIIENDYFNSWILSNITNKRLHRLFMGVYSVVPIAEGMLRINDIFPPLVFRGVGGGYIFVGQWGVSENKF